jgi:eukaryotic-like serine/threonine-protein kinase
MATTAAPESTSLWSPPSIFDQFTLLRPLGRGGMGHVYLGRDRALDRLVALKFISSRNPSTAARERFLVEARAIARLSHPNVVSVFSIGEIEGRPYIAYEFVPGNSLDRLVAPITWQAALRIAVGAARGLEAAHREGILHRDLKPGNIIVSERGEVKLLDFGLAKLDEMRDAEIDDVESVSNDATMPLALTRPGVLMGTPAYIAPEQWRGQPASQRTDVFALGLVLYELIVGPLPHAALAQDQMTEYILERDLPPARGSFPESLGALIDRAVRRDPAERYPSAGELRAALEDIEQIFLPANAGPETIDPERVAVAASFSRVRERGDAFISRVYEILFANAPSVRALFPEDMSTQRQKLLHMIGLALSAMNEPARLGPALEDLGRRHVHYSVQPAHFRALETALLGALSEQDPAWSTEIDRGWRRSFQFIESSMLRGMDSERGTMLTDDSGTVKRWPRSPASPPDVRTKYADNGEASLAYQVFGEGRDIVLLLGSVSHVELNWREPRVASFLVGLGALGRVVVFDKRGTGLSDRAFEAASVEERVADAKAVITQSGCKEPVLIGIGEGAATAILYTAMYPQKVAGLVLYGANPLPENDTVLQERARRIRDRWGEPMLLDVEAPSLAKDDAFREWLALYMRMASSPNSVIKMMRANAALDLRVAVATIHVPTLVVHRVGDRIAPVDGARYLASHIRGAQYVELPGDDHLAYVDGNVLEAIESFTLLRREQPQRP